MLCICGLPVLFQELAMGQFTKQGAIGAWQLIPMMRVQLVSDKKKLGGGMLR